MATTDRTLRVLAGLRRDIARITDQQTRDLVAAYAAAWDEVAADLDDALAQLARAAKDGRVTRTQVAQSARLRKALAHISQRVVDVAAQANVRIVGDLDAAVRLAGLREVELITASLPKVDVSELVVSFDRVDTKAIDAIVRRTTGRIEAKTRPIPAEQARVMRRELIRGVAFGANPNETARRIMARTQRTFEGGAARAVRIARTETLDAMRAGAKASDLANADTLKGWTWVTEFSTRTCPACLAMHGTEHALEEDGPLGHQNCRCTRSPLTKSWRDLGFDIDEPASLLPSAQTYFDGLTDAEKVAMLGRPGYDAYTGGRWPMSSWAQLRQTPDWRDSYVVAKPPRMSFSSDRLAS